MLEQRPLGNTGLSVRTLGYGAFKIGRNQQHHFAADYDLPTEAESSRLLNTALDAGITLIDTAPSYGLSEERIGRAIGHRRDEYMLATKAGEQFIDGQSHFDFSRAAVMKSVEGSLSRLRTDRLDIICVHSSGDDLRILCETDIVPALQDFKSRGMVRAIGFSGKTVEGAAAALDWADVLMVTFHAEDTSHTSVIKTAAANGVGVLVKKGLASGRLPGESAIPFVLNQTGVSSLLIDTLNERHLQENIASCFKHFQNQ